MSKEELRDGFVGRGGGGGEPADDGAGGGASPAPDGGGGGRGGREQAQDGVRGGGGGEAQGLFISNCLLFVLICLLLTSMLDGPG